MSLKSAIVLLFLVMDPLGNVPFFAAALDRVSPARHTRVIVRELVVAYAVMVFFLFAGRPMLSVLGISQAALTLAGGVVLFLIALRMIFPPGGPAHEDLAGEPFIVPLAIPYVAGPSVLATLLLMVNQEPARWREWLGALTIAWLGTAGILLLSGRVRRVLGQRGMIAVERLMGMVLVAIAVQMFLTGLERYLPGTPPR